MALVIFDLDSTLANTSPRQHLSPFVDSTKTWDDYSKACSEDLPMEGPIALARLLSGVYTLMILTGRRDSARPETEEWLVKYKVPYDTLRMRTDDDPSSNVDFKISVIKHMQELDIPIVLFVNDWPAECDAATELGIPSLLVHPRYDDKTMGAWDYAYQGESL